MKQREEGSASKRGRKGHFLKLGVLCKGRRGGRQVRGQGLSFHVQAETDDEEEGRPKGDGGRGRGQGEDDDVEKGGKDKQPLSRASLFFMKKASSSSQQVQPPSVPAIVSPLYPVIHLPCLALPCPLHIL